MKRIIALSTLTIASVSMLSAQSVPAAGIISQRDMRGTARFMSMGGAFGALGGDISVLNQNPGGIGVYRNSDVAMTFDVDFLGSVTNPGTSFECKDNFAKFNLNNIGAIITLRLNNDAMPNFNFGFTYNKTASFNRRYNGTIPNLKNSLSNYIAGICNSQGLDEANVATTDTFDPYNPPSNQYGAPWLCIMGYDALLTDPEVDKNGDTNWYGQFGNGTTGTGSYSCYEKGYVDEYNIAFGGNIKNLVYWGLDVGVTSMDYTLQTMWGESLTDAYVYNPNTNAVGRYNANWSIYDNYRLFGTGVNFKLGFIVKPIQELRIGFAFHTPTFYNLTERYGGTSIDFNYPFKMSYDYVAANNGMSVDNYYSFQTPWRVIASVAGVIAGRVIVSADYEWAGYKSMNYGAPNYGNNYYYDPWYDWDYYNDYWYGPYYTRGGSNNVQNKTPYDEANNYISNVYSNTSTVRLGAEFRVTNGFSTRVGYSFSSSPVTKEVRDGNQVMPGTGALASYTLDNSTNLVSFGIGYKYKGFYADLAYVYRMSSAEYFPFSPDVFNPEYTTKSKVNFDASQLALTLGFKF